MYSGFPTYLHEDVSIVLHLISKHPNNKDALNKSTYTNEYLVEHSIIKIPYRIYYEDNSDTFINELNITQKMIMHCIFSRNCDGFVRQKHLKALLLMNYEDWVIPYIVKLCDEYIVEILEMAYEILRKQNNERIKTFCLKNSVSFNKSYYRMTSYWNEFYRFKHKNFQQYVGRKLFRECFGYSRAIENKVRHN